MIHRGRIQRARRIGLYLRVMGGEEVRARVKVRVRVRGCGGEGEDGGGGVRVVPVFQGG